MTRNHVVATVGLALLVTSAACGPSRVETVRLAYDNRKTEVTRCYKFRMGALDPAIVRWDEARNKFIESFLKCMGGVKGDIQRDLKNAGINWSPLLEEVWKSYHADVVRLGGPVAVDLKTLEARSGFF